MNLLAFCVASVFPLGLLALAAHLYWRGSDEALVMGFFATLCWGALLWAAAT